MQQTKVHVWINPKTLEVKFEVEGHLGESCKDITELLSRGHQVKDSGHTIEFLSRQEMPAYVEDL